MKAKVFISCGQSEYDEREKRIARTLAQSVEEKGYEAYLAIGVQDARSFRENIYRELAGSEYFLFIDLKREPIADSFRGSLFCHQELAVASFLELDMAFFQEKGVLREGLGQYIQSNPSVFGSEQELYDLVNTFLSTHSWSTSWKNALSIQVSPDTPRVVGVTNNRQLESVWYHLQVQNHHKHKIARNCFAFLDSLTVLSTGEVRRPKTVELHWAGCDLPGVTILPQSSRELDAFFADEENSSILRTISYSTSSNFIPAQLYKGSYLMTFRVVSENLGQVVGGFRVVFDGTFKGVKEFRPEDGTDPS